MSAATQRAQKLRAKRRKTQQEETPPLIDLTSDDCLTQDTHKDGRPWKTIVSVELLEEDR